jgi:hypothetical protein
MTPLTSWEISPLGQELLIGNLKFAIPPRSQSWQQKRVLLNMKQESCMKIVQNNDDNNWLFGKLLKFEEITRKKES